MERLFNPPQDPNKRLFQGQEPLAPTMPPMQVSPQMPFPPTVTQEPAEQEVPQNPALPTVQEPVQEPKKKPSFLLQGGDAVAYRMGMLEENRKKRRERVWVDTTQAFFDDTLPIMIKDPLETEIVMEAIGAERMGGAEWEAYKVEMDKFPDEVKGRVLGTLEAYHKRLDAAQQSPLSNATLGREEIEFIMATAKNPAHAQVYRDIAEYAGDEQATQMLDTIQRGADYANLQKVYFGGESGAAARGELEGQRSYTHSGVKSFIALGERIQNQYVHEDKYGDVVPTTDVTYQYWAYHYSRWVETEAKKLGVEYKAIPEMPVNVEEAEEVFVGMLDAIDAIQGDVIRGEMSELVLEQQIDMTTALENWTSALYTYGKEHPESEMKMGEIMDIASGIATGDITMVSQVEGNVPLIIKALDWIATPDRAAAALSVGAQRKVRAVELVFSDGYVAFNTIDAARHAIEIMDNGGVYEADPAAIDASEYGSRGGALFANVGDALSFDQGTYDGPLAGTPLSGLGRAAKGVADIVGSVAPVTSWAAGALFLPAADVVGAGGFTNFDVRRAKEGALYAKPVGVFDRVTEQDEWSKRWENFRSAFTDGTGQFIFEHVYEQATSTTSGSWATKWAAGITAGCWDMAVTPYNGLGTGVASATEIARAEGYIKKVGMALTPAQVRRISFTDEIAANRNSLKELIFSGTSVERPAIRPRRVIEPPKSVLGEAPPGMRSLGNVTTTEPKLARGNRKVRYRDGREMSTWAAAQHDIIAKMFGRGGQFNYGGAEEIAELVMTLVRDSPEATVKEFMAGITEHPKFLDNLAAYAPESGAGMGWKKYVKDGLVDPGDIARGATEAKRRWAMDLWDNASGEVEAVLEAGRITMGKDLVLGGDNWVKLMENTRGIYIGTLGVPLSRASRHIEAVDNKWRAYLTSDISNPYKRAVQKALAIPAAKVEVAFRNGTGRLVSGFAQSHWSTGLAAGEAHILPETVPIPWRMRKLYAEKFRRVMASSSQRAQVNAASVFAIKDAKGEITGVLDSNSSMLVSLSLEGGDTAKERAAKIWANKSAVVDHGIKLPATVEELEKQLAKLEPVIQQADEMHRMFAEGMVERGLLSQQDVVDSYVLHFYHAAEQQSVLNHLADLEKKAVAEQAAKSGKVPTGFQHGTSAKVRQGPIDLFEAMKLGFKPELDAKNLLYYRSMQYLEVETRANFLERLAADFGEPVVRGKEALAVVMRDIKLNRWVSERRMFDAAEEAKHYYRGLSQVRGLLQDSSYREVRHNLNRMSLALGVPPSALRSQSEIVVAMARSDKFWAMASSKSKTILDKILPASLRAEVRVMGREMRGLRAVQADSRRYLERRGVEPDMLARMTDDDLGMAAVLQSQKAQFGESFNALKKRLSGANRAKAFVQNELRQVRAEAKVVEGQLKALATERGSITTRWDAAKKMLTDRGYDTHALNSATDIRLVKRTPPDVVPQFSKSDTALFSAYKEEQGLYRGNFQRTRKAQDDMQRWERQAGTTARRLEEAEGVVASANDAMRKRGKEFGQHKVGMRQHGREVLRIEDQLEKSAATYVEASRRLREAEARVAFMMDGPAMREATAYINGVARRTVKMRQQINDAVGRFAFEHEIGFDTARRRALTPVTIGSVAKKQEDRAARQAKVSRLRKKEMRYPDKPIHVPVESAERYQAVDDFFKSFGWGNQEQSTLLWEVFGAHHLTEVPIAELEALTSAGGGMYAKYGRFLFDPTAVDGRTAVLSIAKDGRANAKDVAAILGLGKEVRGATNAKIGQVVHDELDKLFKLVNAGDEKAIEKLSKIDPKKLSKLYVPEDVTGAFAWAKSGGKQAGTSNKVARMAGSGGKSDFQRKLANTYIPLEIGLVHRQMVREGILTEKVAKDYIFSVWALRGMGAGLSKIEWVNRTFKYGALAGRPNFKFIRRNSWFDGGKAIFHLGLWGAANPAVLKEFYRDMRRMEGVMTTAAGEHSMAQFHQVWSTQGVTNYASRMDDVTDFSRAFSVKAESRMKKRFERQLTDVGKESTRTKGAAINPEAATGSVVGGIIGAVGGIAVEGAQVGFTAGSVWHGWKSAPTHTSGRMPTKAEWLVGHGPAANESLENFFRAFAYWNYVKGGQGATEAINRVNAMMRDYSNLKPFAQEVLSKSPFLFWNFMQQNAIAMTERFLDAPRRVSAIPRMVEAVGRGLGEEYRDEWQTLASSLFFDDKVAYMSDELEAAVGLLEPFYQLIVNQHVGAAGDAALKNFSPFMKQVLEQLDGKIPDSIARKYYEANGPIKIPYVLEIKQNAEGGITGTATPLFKATVIMFGLEIAINDSGRIGGHAQKGEFAYAVLEFFGFGNYYDQESFYEGRRELMNPLQRRMYDFLQEIKVDSATGNPTPWAVNMSTEEEEIIRLFLNAEGGKHAMGWFEEMDKKIKRVTGTGTDAGTKTPMKVKQ